ncbi:hypothetical protein ACLKA7_001898 [Drosophila subpalustris]
MHIYAETEQPIADLPANTEVNAIKYPENESLANEPVLVDSEKTSGELLLQECVGNVEVQETVSALIEGKNDIDSSLGASEKSIGNICDSKADIQSTDAALTSDESGDSDSELIPFEVSTTDSNFEPTDKDKNSSDSSDDNDRDQPIFDSGTVPHSYNPVGPTNYVCYSNSIDGCGYPHCGRCADGHS